MSGTISNQVFPTGPAYQDLGAGAGIKLFAADDSATPPIPGWVRVGDILAQSAASASGVSIDGVTIPATPSNPYVMRTIDRGIDLNKATGAPSGIQLPAAPTLWVPYFIVDGRGDCATNPCTVTPPPNGLINGQPNFVMNSNNEARMFVAVALLVWRIL